MRLEGSEFDVNGILVIEVRADSEGSLRNGCGYNGQEIARKGIGISLRNFGY